MLVFNDLVKLLITHCSKLFTLNYSLSFLLEGSCILFLSFKWGISYSLEFVDGLLQNVKSVGHWHPFCSIDESFCPTLYFLFVCDVPQINVDVIITHCWLYDLLYLFWVAAAAIFSHRSYWLPKVVITFKSLMSFYAVFKLKLNLGKGRAELKRNLINYIRGEAVVCPSE